MNAAFVGNNPIEGIVSEGILKIDPETIRIIYMKQRRQTARLTQIQHLWCESKLGKLAVAHNSFHYHISDAATFHESFPNLCL